MTWTDTLAGDAFVVGTLVILEAVLSFDNAAILAALSRRLPLGQGRRRALNYGLSIAYVLRIGAILGAVVLLRFPIFITIGGIYLVFLFLKHFLAKLGSDGQAHGHDSPASLPFLERFGLSAFAAIILQIGIVDLAFAMDQVVAAVAITRTYYLIIIAAGIGLLALRLLSPYLSRLMDWLPALEDIAYLAVGFVGVLLVLEDLPYFTVHAFFHGSPFPRLSEFHWHAVHIHVAKTLKIGITLSLFVVPILVKLVFKWPKSHGPHHATIEESLREADKPTPSVDALHRSTREHEETTVHEPLPPKAAPVLPVGAVLLSANQAKARARMEPPFPAKPKAGKPRKAAPKKASKKRSGAKR